ncbi:hypothetical protein LR69_00213 [Geobacillus sp. BCO2]|nr:hypothetical protein LR69_00213 [Geobacillus sp. BCO2]
MAWMIRDVPKDSRPRERLLSSGRKVYPTMN